ncbi:ABC transporter ATP-binding protein [candidate division KSB1 bacterium]|nr:ABC transporter ATP-binding protein [candidate division KSB1 bacterium]
MSDFLQLLNVAKNFGSLQAVDDVSLSVKKGEFFALLGPSGCGKTTLLRMIAGFESTNTGRILLNGRDITDLPPNKRTVNTIFQNYALFPHLNVWDNIAFGLRVAKVPKRQIEEKVAEMLQLIQMEDQAQKKPSQISGGQKQRVAIARALINKPDVLLLDEPLAALDLKLRQRMLMELDLIHDQVGITFLYVTHDQGEAMSLSDRIAVMNEGRIEQLGTPAELYESPRSSFVAAFIGDTNFFEGRVKSVLDDEYSILEIEGLADIRCFNDKKLSAGNFVYVSIRPEKFTITRDKPQLTKNMNTLAGRVEDVIYLGSHTRYWVSVKEYRLEIYQQHNRYLLDQRPITWGDDVWISWSADDGYMLERYREADESLMTIPPEVGEQLTLPEAAVDKGGGEE